MQQPKLSMYDTATGCLLACLLFKKKERNYFCVFSGDIFVGTLESVNKIHLCSIWKVKDFLGNRELSEHHSADCLQQMDVGLHCLAQVWRGTGMPPRMVADAGSWLLDCRSNITSKPNVKW